MSRRFPEDHFCETLRGFKKPAPGYALSMLAQRCRWLERKIAENTALGKPSGSLIDEVAAIVMLVEAGANAQTFRERYEDQGKPEARKP